MVQSSGKESFIRIGCSALGHHPARVCICQWNICRIPSRLLCNVNLGTEDMMRWIGFHSYKLGMDWLLTWQIFIFSVFFFLIFMSACQFKPLILKCTNLALMQHPFSVCSDHWSHSISHPQHFYNLIGYISRVIAYQQCTTWDCKITSVVGVWSRSKQKYSSILSTLKRYIPSIVIQHFWQHCLTFLLQIYIGSKYGLSVSLITVKNVSVNPLI